MVVLCCDILHHRSSTVYKHHRRHDSYPTLCWPSVANSRTAVRQQDNRQKTKWKKINSTAKTTSQTFMNLMCRAKATCSPVLSVRFNRKLTLAKEQNTKTGSLPVKHWGHGNSQHTLVCGAEMTTTAATKKHKKKKKPCRLKVSQIIFLKKKKKRMGEKQEASAGQSSS